MTKNYQMRKQSFISLALILFVQSVAFSQSSGGSNYVFYDAHTFPGANCGEVKTVIGTYHLDPQKVEQQLKTMRESGQQKITLLVWYAHFDGNPCGDYMWQHLVSSTGGHLAPQHEENLRQIVTLVRDLGFNELDFRFAAQGISDPSEWTTWNESFYQENKNFIFNTRSIIEQVLSSSSVKRRYDLGVELVGADDCQSCPYKQLKTYVKRLWSDYNASYGKADTYGFSFAAVGPTYATIMIRTYDETSYGRPNLYAFDIYGDEYNTLKYLKNELSLFGEQTKPIIIQESYYNDAEAATEFRRAKRDFGLNITHVTQWYVARGIGSGTPNFSAKWTEKYFYYAENPKIIAADTGCDDHYCIWIKAQSLDSSSYVDIRRNDGSSAIIARFSGTNMYRENQDIYQWLTFGFSDPAIRSILSNPGITVTVVNPNDGRVSNTVSIKRYQ